jgi:hypothetical protein
MLDELKHREYLAKAREADLKAAKCLDPEVRDSWRRIAESYRKLDGSLKS